MGLERATARNAEGREAVSIRAWQTFIDVAVATPVRMLVYLPITAFLAVCLGAARGLHDCASYIRGENGGLRLLASAEEEELRRWERQRAASSPAHTPIGTRVK